MIKILGKATSINVRKVLWTCTELGIEFDRENWGTGFRSTTEPEFIKLNPNALVPVMIDDGFVLWESNTICRYLCARTPHQTLLPVDARQRAGIEQWMDWQATELNYAWRYAFMALVRCHPDYQDPSQIQASIVNWNRHMAMLDTRLSAAGNFVTGQHFSLADIVIGLSVNRWLSTPIERPRLAALADYHERLKERAGFLAFGCNGEA